MKIEDLIDQFIFLFLPDRGTIEITLPLTLRTGVTYAINKYHKSTIQFIMAAGALRVHDPAITDKVQIAIHAFQIYEPGEEGKNLGGITGSADCRFVPATE